MINQTMLTKWLLLAERIYRVLLILYPVDYRREYGVLMVQLFRDVSRAKYRRHGLAGIGLWWCKTLLDLVLTALEQRRKVKYTMSKTTLTQLMSQITGILLVMGGGCWAIAAFSQLQPGDHYSYHGIYQVLIWLFAPGFLLVGLGIFGLARRYEQALGTIGQWTLYLSSVGALMMTIGLVASQVNASLWNVWVAGGILHAVALTAFGLLHLRKPIMPIFRGLPLQMAAGWLVLWLGFPSYFEQSTGNLLAFLMYMGMGLAWLGIGLTVQRQQAEFVKAKIQPATAEQM